MRRVIVLLMCSLQVAVLAGAAGAESIAVVGARTYTMQDDKPLENATIIIRDGRITAVGVGIGVPDDAETIDAVCCLVTPAFMNSATQLGLTEVSSVEETNDHSVVEGFFGAAFDIEYALNANSELLRQARADGLSRAITHPGASSKSPFSGLGALIRLAPGDSILEQARIGVFAEVGGQSSDDSGGSRSAQWQLLRYVLDAVKSRRRSRTGSDLDDSFFTPLDLDTMKEVADGELPLVIEVNRESDIRQAIALGDDYGIRVVVKGGIEAWTVANELASSGVPVVLDPSINLPLYFDHMRARADNAAILDEAGVKISFKVSSIHTSFNAGFALREVAGIAVANGLDYLSALEAVTINPATIWGIADRYGTISAGLEADIIIWDGDPFEPASSPVIVLLGGKKVSEDTRQKALSRRYFPQR